MNDQTQQQDIKQPAAPQPDVDTTSDQSITEQPATEQPEKPFVDLALEFLENLAGEISDRAHSENANSQYGDLADVVRHIGRTYVGACSVLGMPAHVFGIADSLNFAHSSDPFSQHIIAEAKKQGEETKPIFLVFKATNFPAIGRNKAEVIAFYHTASEDLLRAANAYEEQEG